jgi:hypothetical protein
VRWAIGADLAVTARMARQAAFIMLKRAGMVQAVQEGRTSGKGLPTCHHVLSHVASSNDALSLPLVTPASR